MTDERESKLRLIQETIGDLMNATHILQPEWTELVNASFTIADAYSKQYPEVARAFYDTVYEACPGINEDQEGIIRRAFWSAHDLRQTVIAVNNHDCNM